MLTSVAVGCGNIDSRSQQAIKQFGTSMNAKRAELNLLPIPKGARINLLTDTSLAWFAKDLDSCHISKTIVFNQGISALVSETDAVLSPGFNKSANADDLSANKKEDGSSLTITSTFSADVKSVCQQACLLSQGGKTSAITSQEAEKMLVAWGVR